MAWRHVGRPTWYLLCGVLAAATSTIAHATIRAIAPLGAADGCVTLLVAFLLGTVGYAMGRREERLEETSIRDGLTGLFNRRHFDARFDEEILRARRHALPIALAMIDVDNLKVVNDTKGHAAGDDVLRRVATAVQRTARATDIACRYGGDEFAVVLVHSSSADALGFAERLRRAIKHGSRVSVSIGLARPSGANVAPVDIVQAADAAMLRAKTDGRDRVLCAT